MRIFQYAEQAPVIHTLPGGKRIVVPTKREIPAFINRKGEMTTYSPSRYTGEKLRELRGERGVGRPPLER